MTGRGARSLDSNAFFDERPELEWPERRYDPDAAAGVGLLLLAVVGLGLIFAAAGLIL